MSALGEIGDIFGRYRFLLKELVTRDFAIRYRRSYLGFLWVIFSPLITMAIMSAVFSRFLGQGVENYPVYLILGVVTYNFFSEATQSAVTSVTQNDSILRKVYIPKYIFPISRILFSFINFLFSLISVLIVMLYFRIPLTWHVVYLPLVLAEVFGFALGIGLFLSATQVFMRDTLYLYQIIMTLWMYLTPIFYTAEALGGTIRSLMNFNPLFLYVDSVRRIMLYHTAPTPYELIAGAAFAVTAFVIGLIFFDRKQDLFILYI